MKIGFIGTGNMASAIIRGIIAKEFASPDELYLFDVMSEKMQFFAKNIGATPCTSNSQLISLVDVVVLSIKPTVIERILTSEKNQILEKKPLLISIAAGTPTDKIYNFLQTNEELPIVRVMPNINAIVGETAAAICGNDYVTDKQLNYVLDMFNSIGFAWKLDEKYFSNFTALAGSSPAYTFLFIDSIARAGVKHGLPKDLATQIAAQAVLGSAKMILESEESPWSLIDRVSSPGGTTVAGLLALEDNAFISTVVKGIDATIDKDNEMNHQQK
jgi:pyrroline-5-carboxylate reductase